MPQKHPSIPPGELIDDPRLLQAFKTVVQMAREKSPYAKDTPAEDSLAVMQILHTITQSQWETFASTHDLGTWLAFPLGATQAQALDALFTTMERLAFQRDHDALTGIGNRRLFDRRLATEVERAVRSHTELNLLMIDIDDFKKVNDTYGHSCGDTVLARIGEMLRKSVRPYDTAARIGGEEFAVILPATPGWAALSLAKRIQKAFSQEQFFCGEISFQVTFSGGVATLGRLDEEPSPDLLLKSADDALYTAKKQGKNCVVIMASAASRKERDTLVQSHEKQFLFTNQAAE